MESFKFTKERLTQVAMVMENWEFLKKIAIIWIMCCGQKSCIKQLVFRIVLFNSLTEIYNDRPLAIIWVT